MAARIVGAVGAFAREVGRVVAAALDALLAGLILAFVIATAANGPAQFLGIPQPLEIVATGGGALLVVAAGGACGRLAGWLSKLARHRIGAIVGRTPLPGHAPRWIRFACAAPFRVIDALPLARLGAFAAALALVMLARDISLLGMLLPAAALTPYLLVTGLVFALVGAATEAVRPSLAHPGRLRRGVAMVLTSAAVVVTGAGSGILASPGTVASLIRPDARLDGAVATAATPADPGLPGPYQVRAFSYGSGTDARRPAFGRAATLTTATVDASRVLPRLGSGADEARAWFWGFGTDALPINGLAWLPVGDRPFPLVLMVHGNHAMGDFSESGYEYLGRHLARRGFIAVSVDEDFLNGSWAGDWQGREQLVRAWLLLLHLDQWRTWSEQPDGVLHGLVDMGRVALIGHSRGGEAASIAAMLASSSSAPSSALVPWPLGLTVRAVVGIAPSDGQYGSPVVLHGVDLLELQGGHDSDVRGWIGIQQFARTTVQGDGFKAAFWAYRSNHGQFSTVWGRSDWGPAGGAQLNLAAIEDPAAQEDVAKTAIGAFLEASLHGKVAYRGLFQRPMVGRAWLPPDVYLVRSIEGSFEPLTLSDPLRPANGLAVTVEGFASQRAAPLPLRALQPTQGTRGIELRWDAGEGAATWTLSGLETRSAGIIGAELHLSLANGTEPGADAGILDPRVELATTDGVTVTLPLSRWGALPPPLTVQLSKSGVIDALGGLDLSVGAPVEHVLQSYSIPFAEYAAENPAFRPEHVSSVRLLVDRTGSGSIWLAEVGLAGA